MVETENYRPFGDELSTEIAYVQAASLLDQAALFAIEEKSTKHCETVAVLWMELGDRLLGSDDDEEENGNGGHSVGFTTTGKAQYERVE